MNIKFENGSEIVVLETNGDVKRSEKEYAELSDDIIDAFNNIGCPNIVTISELNKILDTK